MNPLDNLKERPEKEVDSKEFPEKNSELDLSNTRIEWCRGKKSTFKNCDFSQSQIKSCYFHQSKFENCNFTGCVFIDSNFRGAVFIDCDFKYALFKNTLVESRKIINNRHIWPNASRDLIRSLRKNAESLGDVEDARACLFAEMDASEDHWIQVRRGVTWYYANHYNNFDKLFRSRYKLFGLKASRLIWGYGESPFRLILSIALLAGINSWARSLFYEKPAFFECLARTIEIFIGASGSYPEFPRWWTISIVFARYLTIGLLASVIYRRFSRR
ncbi:pentapeptide repeat-containing protein [Xanthomonas cannabis]|uniref:pentapeptide repeat-containing protein n=1 Tax=Xanthomonas cannabis TaxID=1885674 RepID=UPI00141BB1E5|nr:pentapeptide repeat-containing protein [Xanthomonas cannabis]NIK02240.1 hypothetical protein [Xanthomonas cannabis]NIK65285.1 hypothetical protein [Xanthomonas cannabis]